MNGPVGPKESGNKDKSLHGLMVALAIVGFIAGSVILFAYAASDSAPDGTAGTDESTPQAEKPVVAERVVDEPQADIEFVDSATRIERLTYVNATTETEQVSAHNEVEIEESMNVSESEVEPSSETPEQTEEEEEKDDDQDDPDSDDQIPNRLLDLLDDIADFEEDEDEKEDKDNGNKGKGHKDDDD
ncbi:MAG TPA: hypothetical protein VD736_02035 [Nitrososphaera sp.]|nr:hypothetical protein [Nitrososphaera sp.]